MRAQNVCLLLALACTPGGTPPPSAPPAPAPSTATGPKPRPAHPLLAEDVEVTREVVAKQIRFLERLAKAMDKGDPEFPDILLRLAQHHIELAAVSGGVREQRTAIENAESVYASLVLDPTFSDYARLDECLIWVFETRRRLGTASAKTLSFVQRVFNEYPDSRFVPVGYALIGDYYCDAGRPLQADPLFVKVTSIAPPESPASTYARTRSNCGR